ncbi:redox-regulated ATPase YchF [Candidatus Woesearchaeota archaeon]|nr:redox-regulated ATPase YchF [Candidatus Woesearchaeota archaeon]
MLVGIVGKPNCGKSTLFKSITLANILIANYPFATIDPNKGFGHVSVPCADKDFNVQCNPRVGFCKDHVRFVPVEVIDVAGLVPGAHEGKGLGNKFLDDLNHADALIHVVDASGTTNERGEPIEGGHDPLKDVEFLEDEINQWMKGILMKAWERAARAAQQTHLEPFKLIAKQMGAFDVTEDLAKELLKKLNFGPEITKWTDDEIMTLIKTIRQTTKPIIIAANKMDLPGADVNLARLKEAYPGYAIIPISAESELALREAANKSLVSYKPGDDTFEIIGALSDAQKKGLEYIKSHVVEKYKGTGVQVLLNTAVFEMLKYMAIFPGGVNKLADSNGNVLPDCFLLRQGSTALDFAASIHTDLAQGFIRAIDVRTKKTLGKEHVLKNCDVVEIISSK